MDLGFKILPRKDEEDAIYPLQLLFEKRVKIPLSAEIYFTCFVWSIF
jgi:hypothetical protein